MSKKYFFALIGTALLIGINRQLAIAQTPQIPPTVNPIGYDIQSTILRKAAAKKTLASWDMLSKLYQVSVNTVTATDKSIEFKSTIFGIHKIFDTTVNNSQRYKNLSLERYIEPYIKFAYQNNFNPMNGTLGVNFSLINNNDKTNSNLLNNNPALLNSIRQFDNYAKPIFVNLLAQVNSGDPVVKAQAEKETEQLADFIRTGDATKLSEKLKTQLSNLSIQTPTGKTQLLQLAISLNDQIDAIATRIDNGFNLVFAPQLSYAFNLGKMQGYSFNLKALKGLNLVPNAKATQLQAQLGLVFGSDTIVNTTSLKRSILKSELGINQVLFNKQLKNEDGSADPTPAGQLSIAAAYSYVNKGLLLDEKRGQPSLEAKLGFLIGKESWLVFPFSYNFETNKGLASVSIKVNLGSAPF